MSYNFAARIISMDDFRLRAAAPTCYQQIRQLFETQEYALKEVYLRNPDKRICLYFFLKDGLLVTQLTQHPIPTDKIPANKKRVFLLGLALGKDFDEQIMPFINRHGLSRESIKFQDFVFSPHNAPWKDLEKERAKIRIPISKPTPHFKEILPGYKADAAQGMTSFETFMRDAYNHYKYNVPVHKREKWLIVQAPDAQANGGTPRFRTSNDAPRKLAAEVFASRKGNEPIFMVLDLENPNGFIGAWPEKFGVYDDYRPFFYRPYLAPTLQPEQRKVGELRVIEGGKEFGFIDESYDSKKPMLICDRQTGLEPPPHTHIPLKGIKELSDAFEKAASERVNYLLFYINFSNTRRAETKAVSCQSASDVQTQHLAVQRQLKWDLAFALDTRQDLISQIRNNEVPFVSWRALEGRPIITPGVFQIPDYTAI